MRTTGPGQSPHLLLDVLEILKKEKVDYAIVGALAASFYGIVRGSLDADAVISLAFPSLRGLEKTFKKAGFTTDLRRGDPDDPIGALLAITDKHRNRVDLLTGIRGMDPTAFSRTVEAPFLDKRIRMIGVEDFIAMKIYAGSPKDLEDAKNALAVSEKSIDHTLLEKVARRFGVSTLKVLKTLL